MDVTRWPLVLSILGAALLTLPQALSAGSYDQEPIPLSRCERSIPVFKLIPAAVTRTGQIIPLHLMPLKRATRQHQPVMVQQMLLNRNAANQLQPPFVGHANFAGEGHRPFILGRRSFGGFDESARSYGGEDASSAGPCSSSSAPVIPAPPCPRSYILSCAPTLIPTSCTNAQPCSSY